MKFCTNCDNMYYISINESNTNELTYYCRNCKNIDASIANESAYIINSDIKNDEIHLNYIINKYTKLDPTLPRIDNMKCPNKQCNSNTDPDTTPDILYIRYDTSNMKYIYLCSVCDTNWKTTEQSS